MKFEVQGLVERIPGANGELSSVLASGGIVKSARTAESLRLRWLADMKSAFGEIGPDYNIEFHCTVTQVPATTPVGPVPAKLGLDRLPCRRRRGSAGDRYIIASWKWRRVYDNATFARRIGDIALSPIRRRWYGKYYVEMECGA